MTKRQVLCSWRAMSGALLLTMGLMAGSAMGQVCGDPDAGDCCVDTGSPACDDVTCCEAVCAADAFCCDTLWDDICAELTATLCPGHCGAGSACDCPVGGLDEGEDCGLDLNGGCNGVPEAYTNAAIGDTFCGTSWATGGTRDTDWYLITVPDEGGGVGRLTAELSSSFPGVVFIVDISDCLTPTVVSGAGSSASECTPVLPTSAELAAGDYAVFVGIDDGGPVFEGFPCGSSNSYTVTFSNVVPPPPGGADCANPGDTELTQNLDPNIVAGTGIACAAGTTTQNFYCRSYLMEDDLTITCVRFGIETNSGGADHPAVIRIYEDVDGNPAPDSSAGDLVLLAELDIIIEPTSPLNTVAANFGVGPNGVPVTAGQRIVVEIDIADGQTSVPPTGIWPGSNAAGATGPTYLKAADCGVAAYVDLASIGFPDSHIVNFINGNAGGAPCPGDLTGAGGVPDGTVDTLDLLNIFANWGPCPGCPQDLTGAGGVPDGVVDTLDLLFIFAHWGPC